MSKLDESALLLRVLNDLQAVFDTDPHAFGRDLSLDTLREVIEAWEATSALGDMFFGVVKADRGISEQ